MPSIVKQWFNQCLVGIDHDKVMLTVATHARPSALFVLMMALAGAIAGLGLLLNSPVVVMASLLLAPIAAPVLGAGFALLQMDAPAAGRTALTVLIGLVCAWVPAMFVARIAPFQPPTAELLLHSQPGLLNLAVAMVAGAAGSLALIQRQLSGWSGAAVAYGLLPPVATLGYGLSMGDASLSQGSATLLASNLLGSMAAAAVTAAVFGFARRRPLRWPAICAAGVLLALCAPLASWLAQDIANAWQAKRIEAIVRADPLLLQGKIGRLDIAVSPGGPQVNLQVIGARSDANAEGRLQQSLRQALSKPITVTLEQVATRVVQSAPSPESALSALPFGVQRINVDLRRKSATAFAATGALPPMMEQEKALQARFKDWDIRIIPPQQPLAIRFEARSANLDDTSRSELEAMAWALQRWGVKTVSAEGWEAADETQRRDKPWAVLRAAGVATWLSHHGFGVEALHRVPDAAQRADEKEIGSKPYRVVVLRAADHPHALDEPPK